MFLIENYSWFWKNSVKESACGNEEEWIYCVESLNPQAVRRMSLSLLTFTGSESPYFGKSDLTGAVSV